MFFGNGKKITSLSPILSIVSVGEGPKDVPKRIFVPVRDNPVPPIIAILTFLITFSPISIEVVLKSLTQSVGRFYNEDCCYYS